MTPDRDYAPDAHLAGWVLTVIAVTLAGLFFYTRPIYTRQDQSCHCDARYP